MVLTYQVVAPATAKARRKLGEPDKGTGQDTPEDILPHYMFALDATFREKQWANERMGWLFTPQALMFAALGLVHRDGEPSTATLAHHLQTAIPVLGIAIGFVSLVAITSAAWMHQQWATRLRLSATDYEQALQSAYGATERSRSPFAFGTYSPFPAFITRWSMPFLPAFFIIAWIYLLTMPITPTASRLEQGRQNVSSVTVKVLTAPLPAR